MRDHGGREAAPENATRVAVVHSFYSPHQPSGENNAVLAQVDALTRAGYETRLIALHTESERDRPAFTLRAGVRVATGRGQSPLKELDEFGPDIVYVHNLFPNFGRHWAASVDVPLVAVLHNYRPLCANGLLYRDGGVCTLCPDGDRWAGLRYACYRDSRLATLPLSVANRRGPAADPLLAAADRVVVLTTLQRDLYAGAGLPPEKLVVMPNFLPDELDPGVNKESADPARDGWLFVGRLSEEKGVLQLVRAWPSGHLLRIVGEGPLSAQLPCAIAGKDIEILGSRPRGDVSELMQTSRGVIFCSMWYEGLPLVYLEALASGTPVLAIGPNVVGRLVQEEGTGVHLDWPELSAVLERWTSVGSVRGEKCRLTFDARYTEAAFSRRATILHDDLGVGK